jgi:hypothetical protein
LLGIANNWFKSAPLPETGRMSEERDGPNNRRKQMQHQSSATRVDCRGRDAPFIARYRVGTQHERPMFGRNLEIQGGVMALQWPPGGALGLPVLIGVRLANGGCSYR